MNIIDRIFPVKYDFYDLLTEQAYCNFKSISALYEWVISGSDEAENDLNRSVKKSDEVRMQMEDNLTAAFTTPFDRGDIYSISVTMNRVVKYGESTLHSMRAFDVKANATIIKMVEQLKLSAEVFWEAVSNLKQNPDQSESVVIKMREAHLQIERLYREGMIVVFSGADPMVAIKKREVYHHIKDASANLEEAVDVLHRIIVRLI